MLVVDHVDAVVDASVDAVAEVVIVVDDGVVEFQMIFVVGCTRATLPNPNSRWWLCSCCCCAREENGSMRRAWLLLLVLSVAR